MPYAAPVPLQKDVRCIAGTPAGREKTACAFRFIRRDLDDGQAGRIQQSGSRTNDRIRADLTRDHPAIQIEDTPQFYDISVFNRCAETGNVLLILDCWQDVHPALVSIPVDWEYSSPYGLLYALDPSEGVSRFVEAVRKEIGHGA